MHMVPVPSGAIGVLTKLGNVFNLTFDLSYLPQMSYSLSEEVGHG